MVLTTGLELRDQHGERRGGVADLDLITGKGLGNYGYLRRPTLPCLGNKRSWKHGVPT
jgi:hypothetical protein